MAEKAQSEADTDDSDVFSHPSSPTTHHRPGHGGVHHHHQRVSRPHGEAHHHGISPHRGGSQDFHDNAFSRHCHRSEPYYHRDFSHSGSPAQHSEAQHHGGHHHHEARHNRRPASMGSYHHDEHLHGHRDERHHRERQRGARPRDDLHRDHRYGEYRRGSSELFGPYTSHSVASASLGSAYSRQVAPQPSKPDRQSSAFSLARSLNTVRSHPAQTSSKVHPQGSSSKTSESWPEEDEQIQKHKTGRAPRTHKKLHAVDLFYSLWEKLSHLIWGLSRMLRKLTDSLAFEAFIVFIVCLNTIMLVAQTFAEVEVRGEWYFMALDSIFLCIYVVEAVLKIIALGLKYFLDPWNNLDFFIMVMAVLEFMLLQANSSSMRVVYNQSIFRIFKVFKSLRALRAIRVLRRLSFLTSLQEVTGTLARSLPSIAAILILMFTCLFLFSVVLRALFRYSDPKRFQNIFTTIFTLFTLLTLDDWSLIYLDSRAQGAWYIIPILMIYIIIQYFIFLNLVIAVLVDNFQMALLKGLEKVKQEASQIHEKLLDDSLTELIEAEPKEVISEHTIQKQLLEKKFGGMTEKQQELLFHFLQLVSGVERYQQKFRSQAAVIDEIVDTAFEAGEEDFRK
ncbi:cation channel sperm-associated protein 1 [Physeter macrocephalus]|uniref:Cation channel sperm-associated protein 1 n=1 Tax=Physeter macrocephalus TaxID=9755 RepID=A0A2Y9FSN0_PHYMC|nr:cation channel sperm-associated protein 1 [Physeter catodon]|eukprot:XP_007128306.1 cation channel sperm-associated protein 1 [Physeter catodon]